MAIMSHHIGVDLLKALGIPTDHCRKAVITLEAGEPVLIDAEFLAEMPKDGELSAIKRNFALNAYVSQCPRLQLSEDVPVSEAFRAKFNAWALDFFGTEPIDSLCPADH